MKRHHTWLLAVALVGCGFALWHVASPAVATENQVPVVAATVAPAAGDEGGAYEYVGSKTCKKCHVKIYKSWVETKHGKTMEVLAPGHCDESKTKASLDVAKDYSADESCLKCHSTGFGKAGGYAVPDASDEKAVKKMEDLAGVGCESCHGPGSKYVEVFKEIKKSKRTYKVDELYAVGLTKIEASTCTDCHNEKSPTYVPFDYEAQKDKGIHVHEELKLRE